MATILKCKICGGDISVNADMTVGTCQYCGTTMTLPRIDTDKKARLFNRANEYRLNNEFDKAYDAYKTITEEDEQESEAYWGMILSEYGIEYVEDPSSHKRIPTCHRTHVQNIQDSSNYKLALEHADGERRMMYRDEAEALDKLQRNILAISSKEDDYDVFICYKETDDEGNRTKDSVLAQEIYRELEKEGIKTFFARISLETHIGENYEPYIYGALSSAKVMLTVAMNGDNLDSVWVKNEWKRFLSFMEDDSTKSLIPVFKDITPYDLPSELSKLQAQDMGKVGAIQDLVSGIRKLLGKSKASNDNQVLNELVADKKKREQRKRAISKALIGGLIGCIIVIAGYASFSRFIYPELQYNKAVHLMEDKNYQAAIEILSELKGHKDSELVYHNATELLLKNAISSGPIDETILLIDNNKDLLEAEDFVSLFEHCLLEKRYPEAEYIIAEYKNAYSASESDQFAIYLNTLLKLSKLNKQTSPISIDDNYPDWEDKVKDIAGIYCLEEKDNNHLLALRVNGTAYITKYYSYDKNADVAKYLDVNSVKGNFDFLFDSVNDKYYLAYKDVLYDMSFIDEKSFKITVENRKQLEMIHDNGVFSECEGIYIKK